MDRIPLGRKTLNAQRPRVDRFVTPREHFPEIRRKISWSCQAKQCGGDLWSAKHMQQKKYMKYLDEALGLEPLEQDPAWEREGQYWPCNPRRKSFLSTVDSILDLPLFSYATFPDLLDWSTKNVLVAALGSRYHKWSWRTQKLISHGETDADIQCCKFDPSGDFLLLGTSYVMVELHDNARNKCIDRIPCSSFTYRTRHFTACSITSLDWSPTGYCYIIGCSQGYLTVISPDGKPQHVEMIDQPIMMVRVSPDARYVAVATINSKTVRIHTWPSLKQFSILYTSWTVKTLAWHPWRSALLGVGAVSSSRPAYFTFLDVPSGNVKDFTLGQTPYNLDSMLFSHRTGELVLSLWNSERLTVPMSYSQIVVLSGPNTVVDQWGEGRMVVDRIKTMIFSPDGSKLAAATADEDLIIWNFLPEDQMKRKKKKHYLMPLFLDDMSFKGSFR